MGANTGNSEWFVECSDDENYGPEKGLWEPDPKKIVELYEKLSKGESLTLQWKLPPGGRRSPTPEREEAEEVEDDSKDDVQEDEKQEPTEFDFDDPGTIDPITPKRTPGSTKAGRSAQKRVATLEKIMGDMRRHKKLNTPKPRLAEPLVKDSVDDNEHSSTNKTDGTPTRPTGALSPKKL